MKKKKKTLNIKISYHLYIYIFLFPYMFIHIYFLTSLFKVCNFVFYKQLISWVIFGKLEDRNNEFFIRLNENKKKNIGRNTYSRLNTPLW